MKKYLGIAAGLGLLVAASAVPTLPAQASWAENAQGNPHFTGTDRSLARSERAQRRFSYRGHRWAPGFSAYGYAPRHYRGYDYYGGY